MMRMPSGTFPPELASLLPVSTDRPVLLGGLPLDIGRASYLIGGEPDVFISEIASDIAAEYSVDGIEYPVPHGGGQVSLSGLELPEGTHSFILGPTRISFYTSPDLGLMVPKTAGSIGFRFAGSRGEYRSHKAGAAVINGTPEADGVVVSGAHITGPDSAVPLRGPAPILVPRGRRRYFAIGSKIGDVDAVVQPAVPSWLAAIPLFPIAFEYYPHFDVAWLLLEEANFWAVRPVGVQQGPQIARLDRAAVRRWCAVVLLGRAARVSSDSKEWLDYVLAAHDEAW